MLMCKVWGYSAEGLRFANPVYIGDEARIDNLKAYLLVT